MRLWFVSGIGCVAMLGAAFASPAIYNELMLPLAGRVAGYAPTDDHGGSVPSVTRGETLGIACADISGPEARVQVVMEIAHVLGESVTGYQAVLATDQRLGSGTVHVRIPDVPGISQHTVNVKVYVTDTKGTHRCDGGLVRIV